MRSYSSNCEPGTDSTATDRRRRNAIACSAPPEHGASQRLSEESDDGVPTPHGRAEVRRKEFEVRNKNW
jgi:hypothetical protein